MNPIAILAFLTGMGTATPPQPKPAEKEPTTEESSRPADPGKGGGQTKRMGGGWDLN